MSASKPKSSRRAFFMHGGAVLGAGVATTVGAAALARENQMPADEQLNQLRQKLANVEDHEAIRRMHLAFISLIEQQAYAATVELFDDHAQLNLSGVSATGKAAIRELLVEQYPQLKVAAIHSAYRYTTSQQKDSVTLSDDRLHASGTFHVEAEICTPLEADCTAAEMARLQGNVAGRRWEAGRFEAKYVKTQAGWKIASLSYRA